MATSEIVERICSTRIGEELGSRGLIVQNPTEEVRRAIDRAHSSDSVITKWRDPADGTIRFSLGDNHPAPNGPRPAATAQSEHLTGIR